MTPEQIEKLEEWRQAMLAAEAAKQIVAREQTLRKEVFALLFPSPKEGTNTLALGEGWKLKGTYKVDRKIDEAVLPAALEKLRELGVNVDTLVSWKPDLKTAAYRELTAEQRAVFDYALDMRPGSPTMELVAPKVKGSH